MFVSSLTALVLTMSVAQDAAEPAPETAAGSAPAPQLQLDIAPPRTEGMVRRSAGQYAAYHGVVADLREAPIGSGDDLDMAMDRLSAFYGEDRLAPAWIAYASIIAALQTTPISWLLCVMSTFKCLNICSLNVLIIPMSNGWPLTSLPRSSLDLFRLWLPEVTRFNVRLVRRRILVGKWRSTT